MWEGGGGGWGDGWMGRVMGGRDWYGDVDDGSV